MSRRDNIRQAKDIIASRRSESISIYEKHSNEISSLFPEYKEIDKRLFSTGAKIMAASIGNSDSKTEIENIRREYDSLALRRKQILLENGYPEDYCDIKYSCQKCSDTGYNGIEICECLKHEIIKVSLEASGLYSLVKSQTFDTFSLDYYEKDDKNRCLYSEPCNGCFPVGGFQLSELSPRGR